MKIASLRDIVIVVAICVVAIFGTAYLLNPPEKEPDEYFTYSISAYDYYEYVDNGVSLPFLDRTTEYTIHLDHDPSHKVTAEIDCSPYGYHLLVDLTEKDTVFANLPGYEIEEWSEGRTWYPDWCVVSKGFSKN